MRTTNTSNRIHWTRIILLVFVAALIISDDLYAQKRQLKKAVAAGKHPSTFTYVADFSKLPLKERNTIEQWCTARGFVLKDVRTYKVDRFGGAVHTFIGKAIFIHKEDQAWLNACEADNAKAYDAFLDQYPGSVHTASAYRKLVATTSGISSCQRYADKYTKISAQMDDRALDLARKANEPKEYAAYLDHFPNGDHRSEAERGLIGTVRTVSEAGKYARRHPSLNETLRAQGYRIAVQMNVLSAYSDFLIEFPGEPHGKEVADLLISGLRSIDDCALYHEKHPHLSGQIIRTAEGLALNGDLNVRQQFIASFQGTQKWGQIQSLVQKEEARIQKAKEERERAERERRELQRAQELAERQRREAQERKRIEERNRKMAMNAKVSQWQIGDKVCSWNNATGTIMGVVEDFNGDRSNIRLRILGGPAGRYDNQEIIRGELIWTASKKWYTCLGDEEVDFNSAPSASSNRRSHSTGSDGALVGRSCVFKVEYKYKEDTGNFITNLLPIYTSWTVEFRGIIESELGDNVKVVISDGKVVGRQSINGIQKKYIVNRYISEQIGETRVLSRSAIQL